MKSALCADVVAFSDAFTHVYGDGNNLHFNPRHVLHKYFVRSAVLGKGRRGITLTSREYEYLRRLVLGECEGLK